MNIHKLRVNDQCFENVQCFILQKSFFFLILTNNNYYSLQLSLNKWLGPNICIQRAEKFEVQVGDKLRSWWSFRLHVRMERDVLSSERFNLCQRNLGRNVTLHEVECHIFLFVLFFLWFNESFTQHSKQLGKEWQKHGDKSLLWAAHCSGGNHTTKLRANLW